MKKYDRKNAVYLMTAISIFGSSTVGYAGPLGMIAVGAAAKAYELT